MKSFIKIIKGAFIGIANILPGISGSMIAVILKVYRELIDALNFVTKHPIKAIVSVWQYIVGVIVGIIFGLIVIKYLLDVIPLPITLLFIGFIIGAIPTLYKEIKDTKFKWHHILTFVVAMGVMIGVLFLTESQSSLSPFWYYVSVFFVGVIYAIAMIIPGLSGATMLMAFGFYQVLLDLVDALKVAVVTLDFTLFTSQLPLILLLIVGAIFGLIIMGKVMHYLLIHFKSHFYIAVLGIVIVSPINILVMLQRETFENVFAASWYIYVFAALLLALGIFAALKLANSNKDIVMEEKND